MLEQDPRVVSALLGCTSTVVTNDPGTASPAPTGTGDPMNPNMVPVGSHSSASATT